MKKFLSKPLGKRLITGLLLIAIAVILGIALDGRFTGPESLMIQRLTYIICVIGVGLGGFTFIFLGWWGFLFGVIFVLVLALPRVLPDPWNRYFFCLYLIALLGLPPLIVYLQRQKNSTKKACRQSNKKPLEKAPDGDKTNN